MDKNLNILVAYATLFDFLFSQADIDTSTFFTYSNFAGELHGGVDVMYISVEACLFWFCIDVIVVRVKVSKGFETFSPWGSTVRTLVHRPMGRFA
jgi:hypothetical protein